jgi:hypothetical protein
MDWKWDGDFLMAHFAQLDESNIVIQVIVIHNNELLEDKIELESKGIAFCKSLFGEETSWIQTSYNSTIRKNFAGIGYAYDETRNAFIPPKPNDFTDQEGNSFTFAFNEETCQWEPLLLS